MHLSEQVESARIRLGPECETQADEVLAIYKLAKDALENGDFVNALQLFRGTVHESDFLLKTQYFESHAANGIRKHPRDTKETRVNGVVLVADAATPVKTGDDDDGDNSEADDKVAQERGKLRMATKKNGEATAATVVKTHHSKPLGDTSPLFYLNYSEALFSLAFLEPRVDPRTALTHSKHIKVCNKRLKSDVGGGVKEEETGEDLSGPKTISSMQNGNGIVSADGLEWDGFPLIDFLNVALHVGNLGLEEFPHHKDFLNHENLNIQKLKIQIYLDILNQDKNVETAKGDFSAQLEKAKKVINNLIARIKLVHEKDHQKSLLVEANLRHGQWLCNLGEFFGFLKLDDVARSAFQSGTEYLIDVLENSEGDDAEQSEGDVNLGPAVLNICTSLLGEFDLRSTREQALKQIYHLKPLLKKHYPKNLAGSLMLAELFLNSGCYSEEECLEEEFFADCVYYIREALEIDPALVPEELKQFLEDFQQGGKSTLSSSPHNRQYLQMSGHTSGEEEYATDLDDDN